MLLFKTNISHERAGSILHVCTLPPIFEVLNLAFHFPLYYTIHICLQKNGNLFNLDLNCT